MSASWQAGATAPPMRFTITRDGVALNLSDYTLYLRFAHKTEKVAAWERACTITDAPNGKCEYRWADDDLATSGEYEGQLRIVYHEGEADEDTELSEPFDIISKRSIAPPIVP